LVAPQAGDGVEPSVQELYEDAPCGYLSLLLDGTVAKANRTFLRSTGYTAQALLGRRLEDILAPSSRLYYATHWRPKLDLSGEVREVPADIVCADGRRLAVLVNATIARSDAGRPTAIRASVFDATDRRRYERELVAARDVERAARERAERLQRISTALAGAVTPADVAAPVLEELVEFLGAAHGELRVDDISIAEHDADPASAEAEARAATEVLTFGLRVGEQDVGELRFLRDGVRPSVAAEEETFLQTCAAQCAQALVRAQLLRESRQRSAQQAAISSLGALALENVALPRLLEEAVTALGTTLRAEGVTLTPRDGPDVTYGAPASPEDRAEGLRVVIGSEPEAFGEIHVRARDLQPFAVLETEFAAGVAQVLWHSVEHRRHDEALTFQATHDSLTLLPNRLLLSGRLQHEIARARRNGTYFAICLLDLDDFKVVNDTLGHEVGDEILRTVGDRLLNAMRDTDMVARLSGDEFVVLTADLTDEREGELVVQRVSQALDAPFVHTSGEHVVGASVGVVLGGPTSTSESVLDNADIAMHHAKDSGRGLHAVFDLSMREQLRDRMKVESELRVALRDGDLRTFYQPVVNARTGRWPGWRLWSAGSILIRASSPPRTSSRSPRPAA
jgi:diguanylate cyclase (GGDEF)-like protein/PAS domain S-box-containing protein